MTMLSKGFDLARSVYNSISFADYDQILTRRELTQPNNFAPPSTIRTLPATKPQAKIQALQVQNMALMKRLQENNIPVDDLRPLAPEPSKVKPSFPPTGPKNSPIFHSPSDISIAHLPRRPYWLYPQDPHSHQIQFLVDLLLLRCRTVALLRNPRALEKHALHAQTFATALDYKPLIAYCNFYLGISYYWQGRFIESLEIFEEVGPAGNRYEKPSVIEEWTEAARDVVQGNSDPADPKRHFLLDPPCDANRVRVSRFSSDDFSDGIGGGSDPGSERDRLMPAEKPSSDEADDELRTPRPTQLTFPGAPDDISDGIRSVSPLRVGGSPGGRSGSCSPSLSSDDDEADGSLEDGYATGDSAGGAPPGTPRFKHGRPVGGFVAPTPPQWRTAAEELEGLGEESEEE